MLKGDIKIRANFFLLHDFQKRIADFFRVTIEDPDPIDFFYFEKLPEEMAQSILQALITAKKSCVLRNEIYFFDSLEGELFDFLQD